MEKSEVQNNAYWMHWRAKLAGKPMADFSPWAAPESKIY
jgi:hypothetical protein